MPVNPIYKRSLKLDDKFKKFEKGDTAEITKHKKDLATHHEVYLGLVAAYKDTEKDLKTLQRAGVRYLHC